jgi:hypothetical protein
MRSVHSGSRALLPASSVTIVSVSRTWSARTTASYTRLMCPLPQESARERIATGVKDGCARARPADCDTEWGRGIPHLFEKGRCAG